MTEAGARRMPPAPEGERSAVCAGVKASDPRAVAAWDRPWDTKRVPPGQSVLWELWGVP